MTNLTDHPTNAIGYIRLSTEMQADEDHALERQAEKLRQCCQKRGLALTSIYEDVGSAAKSDSLSRREGLRDATRHVQQEGAVLVVSDPTRLFRHVKDAETWLQNFDICILSAEDDEMLSKERFLDAVRKGETSAHNIRRGTSTALARRQAEEKPGSPVDLSAAREASRRARSGRSDNIVDRIAHVLLEDEAYRDLSHRALADLLNRRGILTGWKRPWTGDGLKRQRREAEARIREWAEIDAEDEVPLAPEALVFGEAAPSPGEPVVEEFETARLPYFGMF
ncbi:recombinase family protein [Fuscibacter oryzae]|uniref:Recombinase family protein n=1 Tax=Fuscibacter oryzae TaxID=2803939 RepID=A0A8J7SXJ5_9RHOB|nr:recombinase family protein [Fuscibacter oryzae]MBL4930054.1 recombinase family protein [Fuscibacter oryzae]